MIFCCGNPQIWCAHQLQRTPVPNEGRRCKRKLLGRISQHRIVIKCNATVVADMATPIDCALDHAHHPQNHSRPGCSRFSPRTQQNCCSRSTADSEVASSGTSTPLTPRTCLPTSPSIFPPKCTDIMLTVRSTAQRCPTQMAFQGILKYSKIFQGIP